jgi:DNA invertase Pin-like site-specific DNA recombinase
MIYGILSVLAQFEAELIAERITAVKARQRERGLHLGGSRPTGYRVEAGRLVADPDEQAIIARARELRAEGRTLRAVAEALRAERKVTRTLGPESVRRLLGEHRISTETAAHGHAAAESAGTAGAAS